MGCSAKAYYDAENRYEKLCAKFGVAVIPEREGGGPGSVHSRLLEDKLAGKTVDLSPANIKRVLLEKRIAEAKNWVKYKCEEAERDVALKEAEIEQLTKELATL